MSRALFVLIAILTLPLVAADSMLSYSVEATCSPCREGEPANLTVRVFYDVPGMNDRQYLLYNNTNPLQQVYTSKIVIRRIVLHDKLFNTTILDLDGELVFADRRIKRHQALRAESLAMMANVTLPRPTQLETLSLIPCFTIEYERELRQYDFLTGDYERSYPVDLVEQCGSDILTLHVLPKRIPACVQRDCSWYQTCAPLEGCRFSVAKMIFTMLVAMIILVLGIRFVVQEPHKRPF